MDLRYEDEALLELDEIVEWYAKKSPSLPPRFQSAFKSAVSRIVENPLAWPASDYGTRKYLTETFPYAVIYTVNNDIITIIAVTHTKRNQGTGVRA